MLASNESNQKEEIDAINKADAYQPDQKRKQPSPKTASNKLEGDAQKQARSTTILQRAKEYPGSLRRAEVQQLQRTLGN